MLRISVLQIFIFLASLNTLFAQNDLKGIVKDSISGVAIPGVTVVNISEDGKIIKGTTTNKSGEFTLKNIPSNHVKIKFSLLGYNQVIKNINSTENANIEIILSPSALDLSFVEIIGANPHSLKTIAGTATRMDPIMIQRIQPIGTLELLEKVPGINSATDDGIGNSRISVGIRGLDPRRSSRVLLMEDGVPLQPAVYIYPNAYYNPPVERINELEIIKGSSSIKFGPQTMGGVVNYITSRPRTEFGGKAVITGGNNNLRSVFTEIGGWGTDRVHPEIQLLYKSGDGYRDNNHFEQLNGTIKVAIMASAKKNIYLKANINYENSDATYTGLTEYSFRTNPKFNSKKHDNFEVLRTSFDVNFTNQISEHILSNSKFYVSYFDRDWWRENDVFVKASSYNEDSIIAVPYYTAGDLIRVGNGKNNFGNLRTFYTVGYEKSYDIEHRLFGNYSNLEAGGRLHWERFEDNKVIGSKPDAREGIYYTKDTAGTITLVGAASNYEVKALSLYLLEKLKLSSKWSVEPGVRVECFEWQQVNRLLGNQYQDSTLLVVLPGIGTNYQLGKINLFGGIHRGYSPPSSATINIVGASKGNIDLKPERSWNSEIGLRGSYKIIDFELAGFNMEVEDFVAASKGTVFENLGKVRSMGLESFINLHPQEISEGLKFLPSVNVVYTYLDAQVQEATLTSVLPPAGTIVNLKGKQIPYTPKHSFVAGLFKEFKFGLMLSADVKYVDQVFTDYENLLYTANRGDQGAVPSYYIFNASGSYKFSKNWTLSVAGKNLTDKIYVASRLHSNPAQPEANISSGIFVGPRRQLNVTVKYEFGKAGR